MVVHHAENGDNHVTEDMYDVTIDSDIAVESSKNLQYNAHIFGTDTSSYQLMVKNPTDKEDHYTIQKEIKMETLKLNTHHCYCHFFLLFYFLFQLVQFVDVQSEIPTSFFHQYDVL